MISLMTGPRTDVLDLPEGRCVLQMPAGRLSPEEMEDLEEFLRLVLRKVRRSVVPRPALGEVGDGGGI